MSGLTTNTYWPLGPVCTDLDGTTSGVLLVVELDPHVDELAGPERVLAVLKLRPQLDGSGARIDPRYRRKTSVPEAAG